MDHTQYVKTTANIMDNQKHKKTVEKYSGTLQELAEDIGNLHYESLHEFLKALSEKFNEDAVKDAKANNLKLSLTLMDAHIETERAAESIESAWKISKPFM